MAEKLQYELVVSTRSTGTGARDAAQQLDGLREKQAQATTASQQMAAGATTAGKSTRNLGMATLEASRAFEDMQYGMRGVLNNIPGLISMLGGSAGLAGVVSIAAVAFSIFAQRLEKAKQEAKEAAEVGGELSEKLIELAESMGTEEAAAFVQELENLAAMEEVVAGAAKSQLTIEEARRKSLDQITEKLREAAELEIKLAEAQGRITPEQARIQTGLLQAEAEVSAKQAQLALLDDRVSAARADFAEQQRLIAGIEADRARVEKQIAELEASRRDPAAAAGRIQAAFRDMGGPTGEDAARFAGLEAQVAGIDQQIAALQDTLTEKLQESEQAAIKAADIANKVDEALQLREIGQAEIEQIADIAQSGAETALTTAAEQARQAMQAAADEATAEGRQLGAEARAALANLTAVLADGMVDATELQTLGNAVAQARRAQEPAFRAMVASFDQLEKLSRDLVAKAAATDERVGRLQNQVNALNNLVRSR